MSRMNLSKDRICMSYIDGHKPSKAWVNTRFIGRRLKHPLRIRKGKFTFVRITEGVKIKIKASLVNTYIKYAKRGETL